MSNPKNVLSKAAIESILKDIDKVAYQDVTKATKNAVIEFIPMGMMKVPKHVEKKVRQRRINVTDLGDSQYIYAPFSQNITVRLLINSMIGGLIVMADHGGDHSRTIKLLFKFLQKYNLTPIQTKLTRQSRVLSYKVSNHIQSHDGD